MPIDAATRMRKARAGARTGDRRRRITVTKDQLDQLEVRGYLHPDLRGDRADESEAIETFKR